ncbi:SDR family NAD(P)-dependent oxidoreductase [Pelagibius litoralis]|uniref:SDR family NAD(P)-dependent oxidoreductase n=1 Tax=Pelagibius litoralis TaxID=374515 RepID=A0A967F3N3_9PROT|nr:SDR family NAD(P)-dependent oxidoreductase [Pelagibius litoralis]NIA72413.1 SDR family NAD(P)-dependent oxidoreductase [Pelagibius litoralis]
MTLRDGQCAWITGASMGLGRALALRCAREGWQVVASARGQAGLDSLVEESAALPGNVVAVPLDVTDGQAVAAAVRQIETEIAPIGVAVLNAGTHRPIGAGDFKADDVETLLRLNVMGIAHCLEALLPAMIGRRGGQLALVASLAGYAGLPSAAGYGASKAAVINMAESLKPELDALGVKIQVVNPGFVETPLTAKNAFPMPFLMPADAAAEAFFRGLLSRHFEIIFPRRFAYLMKCLRVLPYWLFFKLTRQALPKP